MAELHVWSPAARNRRVRISWLWSGPCRRGVMASDSQTRAHDIMAMIWAVSAWCEGERFDSLLTTHEEVIQEFHDVVVVLGALVAAAA